MPGKRDEGEGLSSGGMVLFSDNCQDDSLTNQKAASVKKMTDAAFLC